MITFNLITIHRMKAGFAITAAIRHNGSTVSNDISHTLILPGGRCIYSVAYRRLGHCDELSVRLTLCLDAWFTTTESRGCVAIIQSHVAGFGALTRHYHLNGAISN